MANVNCKYCGASIDLLSRECPYCGMKAESTGNSTQDFVSGALYTVNQATKKVDKAMSDDAGQDKIYGVLAYLGILWLVPFFLRRESRFVKFHLNQGLVLLICNIATYILSNVILKIGLEIGGYLSLLSLVWFAFAIIGIIHVVQGNEETELPVIGQFRILK